MEKKATLLIKHLHLIYTMSEENSKPVVFLNGFIAIHHDEILDVGIHSYASYIDKDTRIIDGINHIAIPAFIEVNAYMSKKERSGLREQNEYFMRFMQHGTLTLHCDQFIYEPLLHDFHFQILQDTKIDEDSTVVNALTQMKSNNRLPKNPFCISTYDTQVSLQNQMLAAQMLAVKENKDAYELLKAMTIYPALCLKEENLGMIRKGSIANILLLSTCDIQAFFHSLDQSHIAHIIHKGVRIYPNLLI